MLILGANRTGKSSFALKLANKEVQKKDGRVLIVLPDPISKVWSPFDEIESTDLWDFTGIKKIYYQPGLIQDIFKKYYNGLLIFDDFKAYGIHGGYEITALRQISLRRTQHMLDVMFLAHGFKEVVPRFIFTFTTDYILFKTLDSMDGLKNEIRIFHELQKHKKEIDKLSDKTPRNGF